MMCKFPRPRSTRTHLQRFALVTLANYPPLLSSQIGDVKKDSLPGLEALASPGKKEGAVIMVKAPDGTVEAHSVGQRALCVTES